MNLSDIKNDRISDFEKKLLSAEVTVISRISSTMIYYNNDIKLLEYLTKIKTLRYNIDMVGTLPIHDVVIIF